MRAEFSKEGSLLVIAENYTESYALESWERDNIDGCSMQFKEENPRCFFIITKPYKTPLIQKIKYKVELWFLNHKLIK